MDYRTILISCLFAGPIVFAQTAENALKEKQDAIVEAYAANCAHRYNYRNQLQKWQNCLDQGLQKDSTIAYLWQQKAMPYFKARKYEIGMGYIDKAVQYDAESWQPYRAFIKCIFAKTYREAIADFEDCKRKFGNNYVMDHTYDFYIGLCYLQLNEFAKAEFLFKQYIDDIYQNRQQLEHPTLLFYYGISKFEQSKWDEAIVEFDKALKIYPNLSDALYYKALCLVRVNKLELAESVFKQSRDDAKKGYTINEDNTIYETYPYQVIWPKY